MLFFFRFPVAMHENTTYASLRKAHSQTLAKLKCTYGCVPCFHASRECVEKLNRHCGPGLGLGVVHVEALDGHSA